MSHPGADTVSIHTCDLFNPVRHLLAMLRDGIDGWQPEFEYTEHSRTAGEFEKPQ